MPPINTNDYSHGPNANDGLGGPAGDADLPCCPPDDTDLADCVPAKVLEVLTDAGAAIAEATADVEQLVGELVADARGELDGLGSLLASITDELIGAADLEISGPEEKAVKVVAAIVGTIDRDLNQCVEWLLSVGINPPWHPAEMVAAVNGDWLTMLTTAIPAFAVVMGGGQQPAPITTEPDEGDTYSTTINYTTRVEPTGLATAGDGGNQFVYSATGVFEPPAAPKPPPVTSSTTRTPLGDTVVNVYMPPPPPPAACPAPQVVVVPPGYCPPGMPYPAPGEVPAGVGGEPGEEPDPTSPPLAPPPPPPAQAPGGSTSPSPPPPPQPVTLPGISNNFAPTANYFPQTGQQFFQQLADKWAEKPVVEPIKAPTDGPPTSAMDAVNWGDMAACGQAAALSRAPLANLTTAKGDSSKTFLEHYADNATGSKSWVGSLIPPGSGLGVLKGLTEAWGRTENARTDTIEMIVADLAKNTAFSTLGANAVPNKSAALFFGSKLGTASYVEAKINFPMSYLFTSDLYLFQYANPQFLPNQIRTDDAYLTDQITKDQWECWTRANGDLVEPARRVMLSQQVKPSPAEILTLWRRGHISDKDLPKRMRERGVLDDGYTREFQALSVALPTQSDLIMMMVRDAADDAVAKEYQYDLGFSEKYTPQIQKWAKSLGLDDTYFRYMWRSHWHIPSYTQLKEMFHRQREDREEVRQWDEAAQMYGATVHEMTAGPRPAVTTRDDMRQALMVDDMAPGWVDRMIEVSYAPITRTDAVRAYQIGAFTESRLGDAFRDLGYSPADTATLVKYHAQDKARKRAFVTGTWTIRKITSYYKKGYLSRDKAGDLMRPLTADALEVERTLDAADDETAADTRGAAVRGVKRGLMSGEHSDREATALLTKFGVAPIVADRLVTSWAIERDTRYKRLSAAQAVKMLTAGLIGVEELRRRIRNLGYATRDADLIVARALDVEGQADGLDDGELSNGIGEAVANRKAAEQRTDTTLSRRFRSLWTEGTRILKELNRRQQERGEPLMPIPDNPLP